MGSLDAIGLYGNPMDFLVKRPKIWLLTCFHFYKLFLLSGFFEICHDAHICAIIPSYIKKTQRLEVMLLIDNCPNCPNCRYVPSDMVQNGF